MPPGTVKCLVRTIFLAKRGEAQNLLGTVSELRNAMDTSTSLITVGVPSIEELEPVANELATDNIRPSVGSISGLTVRTIRSLRIVGCASRGCLRLESVINPMQIDRNRANISGTPHAEPNGTINEVRPVNPGLKKRYEE